MRLTQILTRNARLVCCCADIAFLRNETACDNWDGGICDKLSFDATSGCPSGYKLIGCDCWYPEIVNGTVYVLPLLACSLRTGNGCEMRLSIGAADPATTNVTVTITGICLKGICTSAPNAPGGSCEASNGT